MEDELKRLLKTLKFDEDGPPPPSSADQARVATQVADLLQRAKALGQAHASDEALESSNAWGGSFVNAYFSAQQIVSNFVSRIVDWIAGQDEEDLTDEDIQAEVDGLAENVGDYEVASAIEGAVMDELTAQQITQVVWYSSPEACPICIDNAMASPLPMGSEFPSGDKAPPAHGHCKCSIGTPSASF